MTGIPRTGLFSRNHVTSLTQRNRALNNSENIEKTENTKDSDKMMKSSSLDNLTDDSPNSSYASIPRDGEGFDDLDAFFNRASTPQKTPKSQRKTQVSEPASTAKGSRSGTPSSHRKAAASVFVAKPLKMISSKIAEHYKKEPRLEVSMSEAEAEMKQREIEMERELELERERHFELQRERELELERENELMKEKELKYQNEISPDDRIQRAKRELEEMSINSSFDYSHIETNSSGEVREEENNVKEKEGNYEIIPENDDVLMDRLVEEMLVNDQEYEQAVNNDSNQVSTDENLMSTDHETRETFPSIPENSDIPEITNKSHQVSLNSEPSYSVREASKFASLSKKTTSVKERKSKPTTGKTGLSRRPMTYYASSEIDEDGLRRSCRMKMEPLRFWANEKVCYGRAEDPSITLPVIVNVIKKPELDDPTFMMGITRKRRRPVDPNASKMRAQGYGPECDIETEVVVYGEPNERETRLVALSHHHVQGDEVKDCSFRIHTIFTEGSYMSSGQLIFPPKAQKPTKNSSRHALVFYVISGSFRVEINQESFLIGPGGQFHVPRSNHYTITHVSPPEKGIEGRLFFCHCKDNAE